MNFANDLSPAKQALLKKRLEGKRNGSQTTDIRPRANRGAPAPLSFAQQRLWFISQLDSMAATAYHISGQFALTGKLNREALRAALNCIMQRHESLRTTFGEVDGKPVQRIAAADTAFPLTERTLQVDGADARARAIGDAIRDMSHAPFDLAAGPLIRGELIQLGDEEHIFLLTMHHIISDGWSLTVLTRELATLYAACMRDAPDPLPPLAIQYADFATWQRERVPEDAHKAKAAFWRQHLAGAPALIELPADRPRPAKQSYRGAFVPLVFDASVAPRLNEFCQQRGITPFAALLTTWFILLARLTGQRDLVVGTPVANRQTAATEPLVGFFVNTLAIRMQMADNPVASQLLADVRETLLACLEHQDMPFDQVVEIVNPARSLGHNPIFQAALAFDNTTTKREIVLPELTIKTLEQSKSTTQFDLSLSLQEDEGGLAGKLEFSADLYDAATAQRFAGYFKALLEGLLSDADRRIGELPMVAEAEREQVVVGWNDTATAFPMDETVQQRFERRACQTPDATALVFGGRQLTYAELNARANRLAHRLRTLGVGPECLVALCTERSFEMLVSLLAILKAGGAYLPLDPRNPPERLDYLLKDAAPVAVLAQPHLLAVLPPHALPCVCLDDDNHAFPDTNPAPLAGPSNIAYVNYTSGSTGKPKGVQVPHRGVLRLVCDTNYFAVTPEDRFLQFAPIWFDAVTFEIWGALLNGATLVIYPPKFESLDQLAQTISENRITMLALTTPVFNQMVDHHAATVALARQVVAGGEALSLSHVQRFLKVSGGRTHLTNAYGPTENTTFTCCNALTEASLRNGSVPIGAPIANTQVYILDANMAPVPIGVAGELHTSGHGLARGYLKRPDLSAEKFIPNPFSSEPGARMYRTGDLARWLPDGTIEYLGRIDHQVKFRGFRIELGEIEGALTALPGVREAVVLAREDQPGDKRLVAYLVADESVFDPASLRTALLRTLPEYMVPSHTIVLDALPLNQNDKVDRKALPAPDTTRSDSGYAAPRNDTETTLAAIWAEVLSLDKVGIHDNFFALGGHSLLATQAISKIRAAFGQEVPLSALFEAPTVAELAERLDSAQASALLPPPVVPVGRDQDLQLSFAQQRLWFLDHLQPGSAFYNVPGAVRLNGALDRDALSRTLDEIVRRHEVLRTTFVQVNGSPVQRIAPPAPLPLPLIDVSGTADPEQAVHAQLQAAAAAPFDLAAGPMIRAALLNVAPQEHVLLLTLHHIVTDGWSIGVLIGEIAALYAAFAAGKPSPLPELAVQYADYAHWQRQWLDGEVLERQLGYWTGQLAGAPAMLTLPTDRPRPTVQSFRGASLPFRIDAQTAAALSALSRRTQSTLFMTLMSAFQVLLSRYAGQDDVSVGTPIANRNRGDVEPLIGCFVNTLVMRAQVRPHERFLDLLAQVRTAALDAYAHQDIPFEQLVDALQPERHLGHTPLFQVVLALHNTPQDKSIALPGLTVTPLAPDTTTAKFDLMLDLVETDGSLAGNFGYNTDLFDAATIKRMAGHFARLLEAIAADPARRIGELPMLGEAEREQLLVGWNDTATPFPAADTVQQRFERQAALTPDATALVFGDRQLGYAELNSRANRLAHRLRTLGVGPDCLVALCAERSFEMLVGLLAILKAGGAYLPLDPANPPERLDYLLKDAAPAVVLAQQHLLAVLPPHALSCVPLDDDNHAFPDTNPAPLAGPDNLAYVNYTSGSTGKPKGVQALHRGVTRLVCGTDYCSFGADDRLLQFAPIWFDAATFEIWGALLNGAALVIFPPRFESLGQLAQAIGESGITTLWLTAAMFNQMVDHHAAALAGVRHVIAGGEALSPSHVQRFLDASGGRTRLTNGYGPTENTTFTCCHAITQASLLNGSVPIGTPIANTQVYILDADLAPVPVGAAGELYTAGHGLARGYLKRPDLSAEKFVPNPFSGEPGARMYRTGDLARRLPDGTIEYLGRIDQQVKFRGFRIELGEIEAALTALPGVREAVVLAREDQPGDKRLVAYLVADESLFDPAGLRATLLRTLPEYMVPSHTIVLDALPLNQNGKIDRKALPAPDSTRSESGYAAPRNDTETALAAIWAEVLSLDKVGIHDNFFALGGHSLLAIKMIERARRAGLHTDVIALFQSPTIAELALTVGAAASAAIAPNAIPADCSHITPDMLPLVALEPAEIGVIAASVAGGHANIEDIYPLVPLQEGMLFHHLMGGARDPYLLSQLVAFDSRARVDAFVEALRAMIARHDVLRTSFVWEGISRAVQVVWRRAELTVDELRLDDGVDDAAQWLAGQAVRLDVAAAPVLRLRIVADARNERWLMQVLCHHLVMDHTTMELVFGEIRQIMGGRLDSLPAPVPYRNFVAQGLLRMREADSEAFFKTMLSDVGEPTAPFGLTDVKGDGSDIDQYRDTIDTGLARRLRAHARAHNVSVASLMHLAWGRALGVLAGKRDVVFGTVLLGRSHGASSVERGLGLFINTLPIRLHVADGSVAQGLKHAHETLAGLLRHEHASLALALGSTALAPSVPLFSTLFNFRHSSSQPGERADEWDGISALAAKERSNYPLNLFIDDLGEDFMLTVQATRNPEIGAQALCAYVRTVLEQLDAALTDESDRRLSSLDALSDADRRQLLAWSSGSPAFPMTETLHRRFEAQAALTPDAIALVVEDQQLGYADLNARANRLAHSLRALGVGPDRLVALCAERPIEMVVGLLAALKAGGACVPLDPVYPAARLAAILDDAQPVAVLAQRHLLDALPADGVTRVCLEDGGEGLPDTNPAPLAGPAHLACVIYTADASGKPRGAAIAHAGIVNRLDWMQQACGLTSADRVLQKAPYIFDVSVWECLWPLREGATLVVAKPGGHQDPQYLAELVASRRITTLHFGPTVLDAFLRVLPENREHALRQVICSGEALPFELQQRFLARFPEQVALHKLYGPTEASAGVTWHACRDSARDGANDGTVPIGRPIANIQVYILDASLQPVPVGVAGELYVAGIGLARAYLNHPALSAEKFLPNPFSAEPGARMYRSGDLARWLPDGSIECRIDPTALPAPDTAHGQTAYVAPRNATETMLAEIWAEVLSLEQIGIHDNFFDLGGQSLQATRAVSRIRKAFGQDLPLRALFESQTVAELAPRLTIEPAAAQPEGIPAVGRDRPLPLSYSQQRLWFLDQLQPNSAFYNIPAAVRLSGVLDQDALSRTLDEIVRRHEILRTTFVQIDGSPVQHIAPPAPLPLPLIDMSSAADPEQAVRAEVEAAAATPFDLANGPLVRARLLRVAPQEHVLLLTMHHIVTDGWSNAVMIKEIASLYTAFQAQQPSPLPELAIQYADYAHWQRQWLDGGVLEEQLGYWTAQLDGAPGMLTLPTDRPRPAVQSFRGASLPFRVDAGTTAALTALAQRSQSTLFMALMAGFQVLLSRYAGQDDVSVGTPIANRNRAEIEPLIGCFINTLVMRAKVRPEERFVDLLEQVRTAALGAYAHQDIPFEKLVDALQPERRLSHAPLFQVMMVLQNTPKDNSIALPGLTAAPLAADSTTAKFDLLLDLSESDAGLSGRLDYNTDLFDRATVERMAAHFNRLLEAIAADPDCRIAELPMLGDAERQRLAGADDSATPFQVTDLAGQRFELRAARAYVLDDALRILPAGVVGNLHLAGAALPDDFQHQDTHFARNPFGSGDLARLFDTGLLARRLPDGSIELHGQREQHAFVHGVRISLARAAAALQALPQVQQAVVLVHDALPVSRRLVGHVVAAPGLTLSAADLPALRASLQATLSEYMLPQQIVLHEALPLTPAGSIDREALAALAAADTELPFLAPAGDTELALAGMWRELLLVEEVGMHDNFFALGGNSLSVAVLSNLVEQQFGLQVPIEVFFNAPTLLQLSRHVDEQLALTVTNRGSEDRNEDYETLMI